LTAHHAAEAAATTAAGTTGLTAHHAAEAAATTEAAPLNITFGHPDKLALPGVNAANVAAAFVLNNDDVAAACAVSTPCLAICRALSRCLDAALGLFQVRAGALEFGSSPLDLGLRSLFFAAAAHILGLALSTAACLRLTLGQSGNERQQHCRYADNAQQAQPAEPSGRRSLHDHGKSPPQIVSWTHAACHHGQCETGLGEKVKRFDHSQSVSASGARHGPDHPGVAALLFRLAQFAPGQPKDGMPPVQASCYDFQRPHPMVAAAQVRQLMQDNGASLTCHKGGPQCGRQIQARPAAQHPQHGGNAAGHEPHPGTSP
jgi:hypothetical protein